MLGLVFNGTALFQVLKQTPNSGIRKEKVEIALLIISISDFLVELIYIIHQGIMFKLMSENRLLDPLFDTLYLQLPWISDLKSYTRPFLLVIVCRNVKMSLFTMLNRDKAPSSIVNPLSNVLQQSVFLKSINSSIVPSEINSQQVIKSSI